MSGRGQEISVANPVNRQFLITLIMPWKGGSMEGKGVGRGGSGGAALEEGGGGALVRTPFLDLLPKQQLKGA